ncbi:MAG: hypothetical protein NTY65_13605 [Planctomycetota bacterium]|nr:hypothetical protein [Planctomycetota bacterium]
MSNQGVGDRGAGDKVEVRDLSAAAARRARMLLVALIALGLTVRLAMIFVMPEGRAAPTPDAWANLRIARSLAAGEGFVLSFEGAGPGAETQASQRLADRTPGYPVMVAEALRTAEQGIRLLTAAQSVIGAVAMALAAYLAWRLAGMWAAAAAAALLVFDPYQVYACALLLPLVPLGLVLVALAWTGLKFIDAAKQCRRAWPWAALAGLFAAAAVYLDWRMAGLPIMVGAVAVLAPGRKRYLAGWAVGLAVLVAALSPWVVRNAVTVGAPVLATDAGHRLFAGTQMKCTCGFPVEREMARDAQGLDEVGADLLYLKEGLGQIADDPACWMKCVASRAAGIWSPWPAREPSGLPLPPVAGYTSLLPAGALALVGAWTLRQRAAVLVWLLAAPVYVTIAGAVLAGGVEDRLPVAPVLAILGGAGLAAIITRPSDEQRRSAERQPG